MEEDLLLKILALRSYQISYVIRITTVAKTLPEFWGLRRQHFLKMSLYGFLFIAVRSHPNLAVLQPLDVVFVSPRINFGVEELCVNVALF